MTGAEFTMLRKMLGFETRDEVAVATGRTTSCVKKWETGKRTVPVYAIKLLKQAARKAPAPENLHDISE